MFILYGLLAGLVAGVAIGGRPERLADIRFRYGRLVLLALVVQVALFSPLSDPIPSSVVRAIYIASTVVVGLVVLANLRIPGLPLVAAGAALNLAAILANGGSMPASPSALAAAGLTIGGHTNSAVVERPVLEPLTDIFALPSWMPLANVFSVGDALIAVGVAVAIAAAMRGSRLPEP